MSPRIVTVVVVSSLMVALTDGCSSNASNESKRRPVTRLADTGSSATTERGKPQSGSVPLPQNLALDLEQRHPNGTYLHVTGVSFTPNSISVAVEAINGGRQEVALNGNLTHMFLVDNVGNAYRFVPPQDNSVVLINSGATLRGSLTFLGPVDRRATSLSLKVNVNYATDTVDIRRQYNDAIAPSFQIDGITVRH
jgi:hypothetical protein